jgi:DNA polymerase-3 subunit delta'
MTARTEQVAGNWGMLGHAWAVDMLREQIRHDTVRQAYLIAGPAGVGRRTLALRFIQALSCTEPGAPCGSCRTCRQIEAMTYPDLAVVQADKLGGTLDVEKIRDIRMVLSRTPFQGKYRFALFLRFEEANASASNALLKTLEEAPGRSILILTADSLEQVAPTIVSRCELLRLRPLPVAVVETALKERGVPEEQASLLAHLSSGRPGYAFGLLADEAALKFRSDRLDDLQAMLAATRIGKFAFADKLTKDKDRSKARELVRSVLTIWLAYWRDVFICTSGSAGPFVNVDRMEEVRALASRMDLKAARKMVNRLERSLDQLDRNVNTRLLVEVLLLDLPKIS